MFEVIIIARQGKLLTGGVKTVTSKQATLDPAIDWMRAMVDGQQDKIGSITINSPE
jgi:hypothetical protein